MDAHVKEQFKAHLEKEKYVAHDPQFCFNCGRSILGRAVRMTYEDDDAVYYWLYCQVDHVLDWDEVTQPPDNPTKVA